MWRERPPDEPEEGLEEGLARFVDACTTGLLLAGLLAEMVTPVPWDGRSGSGEPNGKGRPAPSVVGVVWPLAPLLDPDAPRDRPRPASRLSVAALLVAERGRAFFPLAAAAAAVAAAGDPADTDTEDGEELWEKPRAPAGGGLVARWREEADEDTEEMVEEVDIDPLLWERVRVLLPIEGEAKEGGPEQVYRSDSKLVILISELSVIVPSLTITTFSEFMQHTSLQHRTEQKVYCIFNI